MYKKHKSNNKGEKIFKGIKNRILQIIARFAPGATSLRVYFHRMRGVTIGKDVWIGYDVIIETSKPHLITIANNVSISMRTTIIGHFKEAKAVIIEEDTFIGPGVLILPNIKIGRGAVITAGSVVTKSVPAMTVVQGNPAIPVAKCGIPLTVATSVKEFSKNLTPIQNNKGRRNLNI